MTRRKKWIVWLAVVGAVVLGGWLAYRLARVHGTIRKDVTLDGRPATVVINWSHAPVLLSMKEFITIGGGDYWYDIEVTMGGRDIRFGIKYKPIALWWLDGHLYVVCQDAFMEGQWYFGRVGERGELKAVSRKELPEGAKPWNLSDDPEEWEARFRLLE